jgi:hypothetical protein
LKDRSRFAQQVIELFPNTTGKEDNIENYSIASAMWTQLGKWCKIGGVAAGALLVVFAGGKLRKK